MPATGRRSAARMSESGHCPPWVPAPWWGMAAPASTIPTAAGGRVLGSLADMKRDVLGFTERLYAEHGEVARVEVGPPGLRLEFLMVSSPEGAARVLAGSNWVNFGKVGGLYDQIRLLLGDGILTAQGDEWKRQRRFVQPLFTHARVDGYARVMVGEIDRWLDGWRQAPGTVDLAGELTRMTLLVVTRVLFGDDAEAAVEPIRRDFPVLGNAVKQRGVSPVKIPLSWPTPLNSRARAAQASLYAVCDEIVAHRRSGSSAGEDDLVGLLLAARDGDTGLTTKEIRDQVLIFLLAGHETTSTTLTFALHLLGNHPEVQDRVRAEVREVVGDRMPEASDLPRLAYTSAALQEAMRLYPSAPLIGRTSRRDDVICGYDVPARTLVTLAPWMIHRRPDLWPEPLRYEPERFVSVPRDRHRYAWMPFGGGPRACIGQHFSMVESVLALAMVLREFRVESVGSDLVPVDSAITLFARGPVQSRVTLLDGPPAGD